MLDIHSVQVELVIVQGDLLIFQGDLGAFIAFYSNPVCMKVVFANEHRGYNGHFRAHERKNPCLIALNIMYKFVY